jgi:phospholipase C
MNTPKVVILCMENRSFDEFFGTFPGAVGFYDPAGAAIFPQNGFTSNGAPIAPLYPFRVSSFSSSAEWLAGCNHDWSAQQPAWNSGQMNGWAQAQGSGLTVTMGYYAANDIPYFWQLAKNFLLCDNYFCSVLGPTWPNRFMLMSGNVFASPPPPGGTVISYNAGAILPVVTNPPETTTYPWQSYPAMLPSDSWKIYDDQNWGPNWLAWNPPGASQSAPPTYLSTNPSWPTWWNLNVLQMLLDANNSFGSYDDPSFPNYSATAPGAPQSTFEADARNGNLKNISWIVPPSYVTQHPFFMPIDGECYVARIVDALMAGPDWPNTILIITYDENDGHFDHVVPPTPVSSGAGNEPWVSNYPGWTQASPVGGGFRVPTLIVSPWTAGMGLASQHLPAGTCFDHTSVIQYLEQLTGVQCLPNLPTGGWRRNTFSSLGVLLNTSNPPPNTPINLVTQDAVYAWRNDVLTRLYAANPTYNSLKPVIFLPPANPLPAQAWPPLQQQCYFIMDKTIFGQDEVDAQRTAQGNQRGTTILGPATFPAAFWLVVDGFEPAELNLNAPPPAMQLVPTTYAPIVPPVPTLTYASTGAAVYGITIRIGAAIPDNADLLPVPQRFIFPCDIIFNDDSAFGSASATSPLVINVSGSFTSRLTFPAPTQEIELVETADPFIQSGAITYLSTDLRVYQVAEGQQLFGQTLAVGGDPILFIQNVLAQVNAAPATLGQSFVTPPTAAEESKVSTVTLYPDSNGVKVYNFAVARVTLQGLSDTAQNVRVFFRLFPALSTGTAFDPATLYRSTPLQSEVSAGNNPSGAAVDTVTLPTNPENPNDPGNPWLTRVPLLGINNNDYVTIPFFAVPRVTPGTSMSQQNPDWPNTQLIAPAAGGTGAPVYAFFGCWLDINQATLQFAASPLAGPSDGPFESNLAPPLPISAFVRNAHQCLVAEVAFDPIPIPTASIPGDWVQLAQRNLTVIGGTN